MMKLELMILLMILGFIASYVDNAFGMGFGTLTPILTALGFKPIIIVPVILIAQMSAGFTGSVFHAVFQNVEIDTAETRDVKVTLLLTLSGMVGMSIAIFFAINLSEIIVNIYIGIMILAIGVLMVKEVGFKFSWEKMYLVSGLASFNKALTGGGYGPITTSGQVISGREHEESVATSVMSESILSGYGFLLYLIFEGFSHFELTLTLISILVISSIIATPLGALTADYLNERKAKRYIGYVSMILGVFTLLRLIWANIILI